MKNFIEKSGLNLGSLPEQAKTILGQRLRHLDDRRLPKAERIRLYRDDTLELLRIYIQQDGVMEAAERVRPERAGVKTSLGEVFQSKYRQLLIECLANNYYEHTPRMEMKFETAQWYGMDFKLSVFPEEDENSSHFYYEFLLEDKLKNQQDLLGVMWVDLYQKNPMKQIQIQFKPANPTADWRVPQYTPSQTDDTKVLVGLTHLLRVPTSVKGLSNGRHVENTIGYKGQTAVDVTDDERVTSISFRKSSVSNVLEAYQKAEDLLDRAPESTITLLRKKFGKILLDVRAVKRKEGQVVNSTLIGQCGMLREDIERQVKEALQIDNEAMISLHGTYLPREYLGLQRLKSPTPHLRRVQKDGSHGKTIILVVGQDYVERYPGIKEIFDKVCTPNIKLSEEEQTIYNRFIIDNNMTLSPSNVAFMDAPDIMGKTNGVHKPSVGLPIQKYRIRQKGRRDEHGPVV